MNKKKQHFRQKIIAIQLLRTQLFCKAIIFIFGSVCLVFSLKYGLNLFFEVPTNKRVSSDLILIADLNARPNEISRVILGKNASIFSAHSTPKNSSVLTRFKTSNVTTASKSTNSTVNKTSIGTSIQDCPLVPPNLVGRLKVLTDPISYQELETKFSMLHPGGRYWPTDCSSRSKVAIVIPYRDREEHLQKFLNNLHPMLQRQQLDYGIYVIEEAPGVKFNRALLMNIGFLEALKQYDYDCFIFHDVDLIPEDDRNLYTCPEQPRHMSVAINIMNYRLPYKDIFGGVSALSRTHMETVNGFSNEFWGWGGEDDDMSNRIRYHGLKITRYSPKIARYVMLKHKKDNPNPDRYNKLYRGKYRYKKDGLNNLKYRRLDLVFKKLFTWVLVKVEPIKI